MAIHDASRVEDHLEIPYPKDKVKDAPDVDVDASGHHSEVAVTEEVQQTVPVRREEVRVERGPITDEDRDAALSGPDISEDEHEVTLHEERPVTETETVPVERVRMTTEEQTDEETVRGQVSKEQIDTEGVDEDRRDR